MGSNPVELCEEDEEKALFVDSNLGTHLAVSVSPDLTVSLLKGKLAYEHFLCFPDFGEIKVQKVMVKQNSVLYQLPDSMVIKCAFQGLSKSWFIHMETTNSLKMKAVTETRDLASDVEKGRDQNAAGEGLKESAVDKVATSAKGTNFSESLSALNLNKDENPSEETRNDDNTPKFVVSDENGTHTTEETSVTGIIFRYFCESDEISSCSCRPRSAAKSDKSTKARKRSKDENVRSSYVADLNAEQSKQGSLHVKKRSDIPRKRKKVSSSVIMNKHKSNRNGAMVNSTPTSPRRISSLHSPFGKHMDALNRSSDKSEVGKRLVQAANDIRLSANTRQSPISLLIQTGTTSMSAPSVRHLVFEIDHNEDEEHL